nr:T9SS type A sorting domain-containing protein [Bacteroidota bacterium]
RDVMVANPHTSTSLQLLSKLDDRGNPMPVYMKAQILAGRSIQSLKSDLEGQIAGHKIRKARAMNQLARYFTAMPQDPGLTDSLVTLYQSDNSLNSRYMLAWLHLHSGQYQQGQSVITDIPSAFNLTDDELAVQQNIQWLYTTLKGLFETGNSLEDLSTAQIGQLQGIVTDKTGFASVYARNILMAIDELEYEEPVILPDHMKSSEAEEAYQELLSTLAPKMLEVYPNPSKDFVILGYKFDKETRGMIEIRDVAGRLMESIPFTGMQDQVTVTTRGWTPGVYVLSLIIQDKVIETTKFTLIN